MAQENPEIATRFNAKQNFFKCIAVLFLINLYTGFVSASNFTINSNLQPILGYGAILLPFAAAILLPLVHRKIGQKSGYYAATISLGTLLIVLSMGKGSYTIPWMPSLGINFSLHVDGLSVLLGALASAIGILVFSYSVSYMHDENNLEKYYTLLLIFLGSMLGIAFSGDLVMLFIFWELTSICSFFLIGFYKTERASKAAARKAMIITIGGGLFLLSSILMINAATGTFSLVELLGGAPELQQSLRNSGLFLPAMITLFIGAAAKSAQVPLHIWLPDAMQAPTPVSAFLHSATMVKAGVFLIGVMRPLFISLEWAALVVPAGLLTMIITGSLAIAATDIKELLAYSTASHLGLITASFGLPLMNGAQAGVLHILNHASFKAPLFLVAGIVAHQTGTRKISELSGLNKFLPITSLIAIIASFSMAGIPPFNGFQSKELFFKAGYTFATQSGGLAWLVPVAATFGGAISFAYSIKFASIFWGKNFQSSIQKPSLSFILPPAALLLVLTSITAFPGRTTGLIIDSAATAASLETSHLHLSLIPHISPPLAMSGLSVAAGMLLYRRYSGIHEKMISTMEEHQRLTANYWYRRSLDYKYNLGIKITDTFFHGSLRGYNKTTLLAFSIVGILSFMISGPWIRLDVTLSMAGIFVVSIAILAGVASVISDSHISGVLNLSVLGAMVSIFYILARAPDLALTQLLVETLSLVIFILVLDKLPSFYGGLSRIKKFSNFLIAMTVGVFVTIAALAATTAAPEKISDFFIENAVPEGGGGNIVNVILVDFRGFDTLGEISVVAMAALSILTLLAMRDQSLWFTEVEEE